MKLKFWEDLKYEHKILCIFLLVHFFVWTGISLIRVVLPTDALEGIYWGSLHDFGTPKHPPFAGWVTYWVYSLFKTDLSIYVLSQLCIIFGFYFIYKLARKFLDVRQSVLSVVLLEGCWVYGYITGYYGFNPDVILLFFLPLLTYIFCNCMEKNTPRNWILLGLVAGVCFLNKYQTALVILPMATWAFMFKRETFRNKYFYLSVILAFLIFLPHLLWLIRYEFFSILYFEGELTDNSWIGHIIAPLKFLIVQISVIIGSCLIFVLLKFKQKSSFKFAGNLDKEKVWFLLLFAFCPLMIHLLMGLSAGGTMRPRWGFEFLYLTGIMLFYFFPTKDISKEDLLYTLNMSLVAMTIILLSLGTLLAVEKNYRSRYPVSVIYNDMINSWNSKYNTPLKYFGGYIEWTLPLVIYGDQKTDCILDTNGYKNPWIDENDLKKSGILVLDRNVQDVEKEVRKSCPYLAQDYEIVPIEYKFTVTNALNMPREYTIYYYIVPPMN